MFADDSHYRDYDEAYAASLEEQDECLRNLLDENSDVISNEVLNSPQADDLLRSSNETSDTYLSCHSSQVINSLLFNRSLKVINNHLRNGFIPTNFVPFNYEDS